MFQDVWGWQISLYLFLGGMGASAFSIAAMVYLRGKEKGHERAVCVTMWSAVLSLAIGLLLLLADLIQPARGLMMWQSFSHLTSWMSIGAWLLFVGIIAMGLSAVLATDPLVKLVRRATGRSHDTSKARKILGLIGAISGVCIAVYTGILLMQATGVPLWNTVLIPCLFTVSAIDTGIALFEIISLCFSRSEAGDLHISKILQIGVVVLVVFELIVLFLLLGQHVDSGASAQGAALQKSIESLTTGLYAPYFWVMVVAIGLLIPLLMAVVGLVVLKRVDSAGTMGFVQKLVSAIGATGALIGGCELRFLVVAAGVHLDAVAQVMLGLVG